MFKLFMKWFLVFCALSISACTSLVPSVREEAAHPILEINHPHIETEPEIIGDDVDTTSEEQKPSPGELEQKEKIDSLKEREAAFSHKLSMLMSEQHPNSENTQKANKVFATQVSDKQEVSLHFDNADLVEVVRLFMQNFLKKDFLLFPGVLGKVTIEIDDSLTDDQIQHLLEGILQINKMTMLYQDSVWKIMPLDNAPQAIGGDGLLFPQQNSAVRGHQVKAYRLKYISVAELVKILTPYLSKGAQVYAHDPSGIVLVSDYPHVLAKINKLIELFDVGPFAGMSMKVYWPKYVLVDDLIKELDALTKSLSPAQMSPNSRLTFVALPRLNLLLTMTRNPDSLAFADMWIEELDREAPKQLQPEHQDNIFVYSVTNGSAADIVQVLQGLFGATAKKEVNSAPVGKVPPGVHLTRLSSGLEKNKSKAPRSPEAVSGTLGGDVTFVVDEITNAILIRCSTADYHKVLPVIKRLDSYPKQALIEVTIAEIQLDESTKLGVEWKYLMNNVAGSSASGNLSVDSGLGVVSGSGSSLIGSGLSYLLVNTDRFTAALKAFTDQNRVHILSSPHILASDNKEAKIDIGDEVPIVTSEYRTTDSSSTSTSVDKTIQYRDVGILLSVTPHIHDNGMVKMEVSQEISEIANKTVEGVSSPIFSKRAANTILSVRDGQTIVIAGLMQQSTNNNSSGVPLIGRLPLLRYLFGYEGKSFRNTELMIFITPHVIVNEENSEFINKQFLERLKQTLADMGL